MSLIPEALKGHIGQACKTYSDVKPFAAPLAAEMATSTLDAKLNANGKSFIITMAEPMARQMAMRPVDIGRSVSLDIGGRYVGQ